MSDTVRIASFAAMGAAESRDADGTHVVRKALLFRAGEYPSHKFSLTPDEQRAAASRFQANDVIDTHKDSIFNGRVGSLHEVWTSDDGMELYGTVAIPKWLDEEFRGETLPFSCEWTRDTKDLRGLAFTTDPQVSDARLLAAFTRSADFAGRRHSEKDQGLIERGHKMAHAIAGVFVGLGARPAEGSPAEEAAESPSTEAAETTAGFSSAAPRVAAQEGATGMADEGTRTPTRMERFMAWLGGEGEESAPMGTGGQPTAGSGQATAAAFSANDDPTVKALQSEVAALKADKVTMLAEAFADEFIVTKHTAIPAERDGMLATFSQAYADDAAHPAVVFFGKNADGTDRSGTRVAALRAMYEARPRHLLTQELLRDNPALNTDELRVVFAAGQAPTDAATPTPEGKAPSAERIAHLKRHIPGATD